MTGKFHRLYQYVYSQLIDESSPLFDITLPWNDNKVGIFSLGNTVYDNNKKHTDKLYSKTYVFIEIIKQINSSFLVSVWTQPSSYPIYMLLLYMVLSIKEC